MSTVHARQYGHQPGRPAFVPSDRIGIVRPDLIPVAAYLITEGYCAPEYCLERLANGETAADLVRIGLLEPADELAVALLLSPCRGGAPTAEPAEDDDFPMSFARMAREHPELYREHQRRFAAEVREFYATHPDA